MAVLVVDDERNFRRVVEAKLRKSSFDVSLASDAVGALDLALQQSFALILLDLHLPDAEGTPLVRLIRAAAPDTPLVVMTAYEEEGLRERALAAGADEVLYKPFDLDEMVRTLERLIALHRGAESAAAASDYGVAEGRRVSLSLADAPDREYAGRVTEVAGDAFTVGIAGALDAAVGAKVGIRAAAPDGLYDLSTHVVEAAPGAVTLAAPAQVRHRQRRRHPRLPCAVRIRLTPVDGSAAEGEYEDGAARLHGEPAEHARAAGALEGMTANMSLGGALMLSRDPLQPGAVRLAEIGPWERGGDYIRALAEVARAERVEAGGVQVYRLGLHFPRMRGEARDRLRSHIEVEG